MDFCYFIGIDIAKETLDWAVCTQQGVQFNTHTPNTLAGIKTALAEFKALPGWHPKLAVFCMEHTAKADRGYLQPHRRTGPFAPITQRVKTRSVVRIIFTNQTGGRDAAGQNG